MEDQIKQKVEFFRQKIHSYQEKGLKIFATSSFQTHSLPMLHILGRIDNTIPVYFLNTGFHFPETIVFKNELKEKFGINIIDVYSPVDKIQQMNSNNHFFFTTDQNHCCYLNKTLPLEPVLNEFDVWISGVRKDQNSNRKGFNFEEEGTNNVLRFHPMLDWSKQLIWKYIKLYDLPRHPLESEGYFSVGCEPCTRRSTLENLERDGRWFGSSKVECGLHTDLIKKTE